MGDAISLNTAKNQRRKKESIGTTGFRPSGKIDVLVYWLVILPNNGPGFLILLLMI